MFKSRKRRPNPDGQNEAQEMILLTLARAEENGITLSTSDLGRDLEISRSQLEASLGQLAGQRLILDERVQVSLSPAGRSKALSLLRRHRLTERLLTDVLGLDWVQAHTEADRFEHTLTPQAEEQIAAQLGDPDTCPHGNPIPNAALASVSYPTISLAQCEQSSRVAITRIAGETSASLQHLATLGLLPDVEIHVENKAPFGGPVLIRVGRAHYALGRDLASRIWVKEVN